MYTFIVNGPTCIILILFISKDKEVICSFDSSSLYVIIISLIGSLCSFISICNSYIAHIKCRVCMNPPGQYFIYPPFAQSLSVWCVCVTQVCVVIRGQLMITLWLDVDQEQECVLGGSSKFQEHVFPNDPPPPHKSGVFITQILFPNA